MNLKKEINSSYVIPVEEFSYMDYELVVYVDGSSRGNPGPAGIGVVVFNKQNQKEAIAQISKYIGITTNNVAEYEALISALNWLLQNRFKRAEIYLDSELVYKQLNGEYRVRDKNLQILAERARGLLNKCNKVDLKLIARGENKFANKLAQYATKSIKYKGNNESKKRD
jgi:ribonuclease HI